MKKMIFKISVGALLLAAPLSNAQAEIDQSRFIPAIKSVIQSVIIPSYEDLTQASSAQLASMQRLCTSAAPTQLSQAREDFKQLVDGWSRVEMYRFGPARTANRQEKLFFWPDRRSRGIKQVKKILNSKDDKALTIDNLMQKSVAVQGLTALEFVLFGAGSETLASAQSSSFRCLYGQTIAKAIHKTSTGILSDWQKSDGYATLLMSAGKENPVFQSDEEVFREILQRADELILSLVTQKLDPALKSSPTLARPKLAPFWRSNLTLRSLDGNLASLLTLQQNPEFLKLLGEDENGFEFEISHSRETLKGLMARNESWNDLISTPEYHEKIQYLKNPLNGAHLILSEYYPEALGITMGFNSLDGD
ncbi:MAG: imelysin family protein [Sneathiella sp.]